MNTLSKRAASPIDTVNFLGLTIQPRSMCEMNKVVEEGIRERRKLIISNHNLHSVYLFHKNKKVREFYARVHFTYLDGMPLVALGRLYGYPLQRDQRVTNADWTVPLLELATARGWRVFYLGSRKEVAEKSVGQLRNRCPGLQIEASDGYFDARCGSAENEAVIERINAYRPDLLMVGMGMPRQEFWTQENYGRLEAHVILSSSGAALDYIAGVVPTPPRWAGRLGLEWMFRLVNEPRRLFTRYLIEPWYILLILVLDYPRAHALRSRARAHARGWSGN
jgi:N-acetylglucosaminyldiphosphoundecaprenol N-acetyl-beta-D-mannosaminyltransferase